MIEERAAAVTKLPTRTHGGAPPNGNAPGAPDLMFDTAPPYNAEAPLFDYASDVEPSVNPGLDKGLQMIPGASSGCTRSDTRNRHSSSTV